jgi:3-hydroxyacyl-[acyl-carrier-protein] dehydratase
MPPKPLIDLATIDPARVVADIEAIRQLNPQRHEFEQLSWICHDALDVEAQSGELAGVLEVPEQPFWARGHVPGRPLMPGVMMVEAAAQLCSYAIHRIYGHDRRPDRIFGFAGLEDVRFRGSVSPPSRLLILGRAAEVRPRRGVFDTQAFVEGQMVYEGRIIGMWV